MKVCSCCNIENEKELIKLNHYTNLQLLKSEDNLKKSDKLVWVLNGNLYNNQGDI